VLRQNTGRVRKDPCHREDIGDYMAALTSNPSSEEHYQNGGIVNQRGRTTMHGRLHFAGNQQRRIIKNIRKEREGGLKKGHGGGKAGKHRGEDAGGA